MPKAKLSGFITPEQARIILAPLILLTGPELQVVIRGALCLWAIQEHGLTFEDATNWADNINDEIAEYARALGRRRAEQN